MNILEPVRRRLAPLASKLGYDERNWLRIRQIEAFTGFLHQDHRKDGSVLEISPGWNETWKNLCPNYRPFDFPEYDITRDVLAEQFDIVIADQVLEHVSRPLDAVRNIYAMLKPGGHALIATPFLFRVHGRPQDFHRWTPEALALLLTDAGFREDRVQTFGWGNKRCVRAHVGGKVKAYGFHRDLSNDTEYPMIVWAFASK